jgi:hypothetical protein
MIVDPELLAKGSIPSGFMANGSAPVLCGWTNEKLRYLSCSFPERLHPLAQGVSGMLGS